MDWLLELIPGGGLTAIIGAVIAGIAALGTLLFGAKRAGRDAERAKKVDEYEKHLEEIERAASARAAADRRNAEPDRLRDDDGYKRRE